MSKKPLLVLFVGATFALAGCHDSQSVDSVSSSSSTSENDVHYYLTGDLSLGNGNNLELSKNDNTYSATGVTLRRGDSFLIQKDNSSAVSYENLANKTGFTSGKNGYIRVLNEGVYDISLTDGETPTLALTKTGSTYQNVKLVLSDGTASDFTLNDDFTYTLSNANLLYRENFYVALDDERLSFGDYNYNDLYYEALRFGEDKVNVIKKGTFQFALNFANENALTITSENLKAPNAIPTDADSYTKLINTFKKQFVNEGTRFVMTKTVTDDEKNVTKTFCEESMSLKEHYCYEKDGEEENAAITERSYVMNDTNYYEITKYTNSSSKSTLKGYLLGEAPNKDETNTDSTSTIVKLDKNYITEKDAKDNLKSMSCNSTMLVESFLMYAVKPTHVSHTSSDDAAYLESLQVEANYTGTIGDTLTLTAKNIEKYYPYYSSSSNKTEAAKNTITLTVDNDGHLTSGTILTEKYSSSNSSDIFDNQTDKNLKDTAPLTETIKYEFTFTYGEQTNSEYKLDPADYALNYVVPVPVSMTNGEIFELKTSEYEPLTALDKSNLQIIEYDSTYFEQGNAKSTFTAKKAGDTTVYIGNLYSNIREEVAVSINYASATRISISAADYSSISTSSANKYYAGIEKEFTATVNPSTADPAVTVTSSNETKVKVKTIDDLATQRNGTKVNFTLEMLAETDENESVAITVASVASSSIKQTFSIQVLKALTIDDFVGTYYFGYYSSSDSYDFYSLSIASNGAATFTNETDSAKYDFSVKAKGDTLILDQSSDLAKFEASLGSSKGAGSENLKTISLKSCETTSGTNLIKEAYSYGSSLTMTQEWSQMETFAKATDTANSAIFEVLSLTNNNSGSSSAAPAANVKVTYLSTDSSTNNVLTFRWMAPTYSSSYATSSIDSIKLNGSEISYPTTSVSISDNTLKLSIKKTASYSSSITIDVSFTFTPTAE